MMNIFSTNNLVFIIFTLISSSAYCNLVQAAAIVDHFSSEISPAEKFTVFIVNYLPIENSTLEVQCASGNDHFEAQYLDPGQYFQFKFRVNLFRTTLFYCRYVTKDRQIMHDVFNKKLGGECETGDSEIGNKCVWLVMLDGFYLGNQFPPLPISNFIKKYDW